MNPSKSAQKKSMLRLFKGQKERGLFSKLGRAVLERGYIKSAFLHFEKKVVPKSLTSFIRWWLIFSSGKSWKIICSLQEERHHREELAGTSEAAAEASSDASTASKSDSNSDKKSLQYLDDVVIVHENSEVPIKSDFSPQVKKSKKNSFEFLHKKKSIFGAKIQMRHFC